MKKYISMVLSGLLMCSCIDTVILPDDKTVDEDFWKSKSDVALMVNGAYKSMLSTDFMMRLIVWGDMRSDELVPVNSISNGTTTSLTEINAAGIQTTNIFADWATFYSVINNCNIVLKKAAAVMDIDPYYTDGDYLTDRSQMLALRALCYFYLVRNFRDVPYSSVAYMNSSQEMMIPQTAPAVVLQNCINDLEEAENIALSPDAYTYGDWRRTGYINRDAVRAILADIYLWRASVTHSESDYEKCVYYCDLVIESKKNQDFASSMNPNTQQDYPLLGTTSAFYQLFVLQNAKESIFELQFSDRNSNTGLCQALYKWQNNNSTTGFMKASRIFGSVSANNVYDKTGDTRRLANCYEVDQDESDYFVRKMTANTSQPVGNPVGATGFPFNTSRNYAGFDQNYIIYRLTDVMLMKAEAMVEIAGKQSEGLNYDDDDADKEEKAEVSLQLQQAFNVVKAVNDRSIYEGSLGNDSLRWTNFKTKEEMEKLVLKERMRELCFEGKRWYDLMRYNYRHVEGVDYNTILAEQGEDGYVKVYGEMLNLLIRKYTSGGNAIAAKLRTEPWLYMPVIQSQIDVNPNLKQNPVYRKSGEFEKN